LWSTFITAVNAGIQMLTSDSLIAWILEEYLSQKLTGEKSTALKARESEDSKNRNNKSVGATVKGVTGRDVASESWSSLETDGLGVSLCVAPSHNYYPIFQRSPTKNVWSHCRALKL
jgi:hypothetical protein